MKKMLVLDLDGTLLNDDKTISDYTLDVLHKFKEKGGIVVIATGRSIVRSLSYSDKISADAIIALNGSMIYVGREAIYQHQFDEMKVKKLINELLLIDNIRISIFYPDRIITNEMEFVKNGDCIYDDLSNFNTSEIQKIFAYSKENDLRNIIDFDKYDCKVYVDKFDKSCYVIMEKSVNKMYATIKLCDYYNFSMRDVVSFGDDFNDFDLIKNSGKGIAVMNANENLKSVADDICFSNNDNGPARWIEDNLLV